MTKRARSTASAHATSASAKRSPPDAETGPRLSRHRKPEQLSVADWQLGLRRQFGREQTGFTLTPFDAPGSGEFSVYNPDSKRGYRVVIRGLAPGQNYCACADFATNGLGTCKHVEFTLARLLRRRGGKKLLEQGLQPSYSEIYLRYAGVRRLVFHAGAECPASLRRLGEDSFAVDDDGDDGNDVAALEKRIAAVLRLAEQLGHEVRFYDDARRFVAEARDVGKRHEALVQAYPKGAKSAALQRLLKTRLYPYQAEGALFLARAGRALLGDEMGLGKTVQAIAATELLSRHAGARRVLIVCPASLKHQWQREIGRFTRRRATVIQGLRPAREQQYAAAAAAADEKTAPWALITGYETLARDHDLIAEWAPDIVIVDEAQRIKNWNTVAARALKRIDSPYAIVLTGTPLENRLEELISIVQFVDQHRLGPTWRLLHEHQQRDEVGRVIGYRELHRITATLAPIMLRRRKAEVLAQLPERIDSTVMVPMTPVQQQLHTENAETVARIVLRWRRTGFLSDVDQRRLTCALQNMRMVCNSSYLLDQSSDHGHKIGELMERLDELLADPEAKVVIFSQWLRTHELIERSLRGRRWGHVLFHGGVPVAQRSALIDRFHQDADCRLFLSTDAGGVGLNLQHAAATVINMDLPWNPAVLEQRIGRVHRMGQRQRVQMINLVAEGGIEEGMLQLLAFKRSLFAGVLDGGSSEIFLEGSRLSRFMDSVERVTEAARAVAPEPAASAPVQSAPLMPAEAAAPAASAATAQAPQTAPPDAPPAAVPAAGGSSPWQALAEAGLALLSSWTRGAGETGASGAPNAPAAWIERDPASGRDCLKLPLPEPAVLERAAEALRALAELAAARRG